MSRGGCRFRRDEFKKVAPWWKKAITRTAAMIAEPDLGGKPKVKVEKRCKYEGDKGGGSRVGRGLCEGGAADKYDGIFYAGRHKFDLKMQEVAFASWDRWL